MSVLLHGDHEESGMRDRIDVLHDFQTCFFAMSRLSSFPWTYLDKELEHKSSDLISDILKQTCIHPLCRKHPPSVRYRRQFLTELIKRHEASDSEPLDQLYEALGEVLGAEEKTECYKSYFLPCGEAISLCESVALISEGTTGLVTWEAALYLAEWALDNLQVFHGRTVLELGSGAGLTGMAVCRSCQPTRFVFTDCHPRVLCRLRGNLQLNGLGPPHAPWARVEPLDWDSVSEERLAELGAQTVIAADVVYDPDITGCLVKLLTRILRRSSPEGSPDVFICSTIRNPQTYHCFKQQLRDAGLAHEVLSAPLSHSFPYSWSSNTELIRLLL